MPIALSALSAVVTFCAQEATARDNTKPNVILLIADDLGYGDLECYGAQNVETPNVNALANSGIRFTNVHATAATSTPSRYSLLTGEYAWRRSGTGVAEGNAGSIIGKDRYTMADMFHDAGYTTAAIGKWHLGLGSKTGQQDWNGKIDVTPRDLGFDYHYIQAATADRVPCVYLEQDTVANYDPTAPIQVNYSKNFDGEPTGQSHRSELKLNWSHGHNQSIVDGISRIGYMKGGGKALWKDENIADSIVAHTAQFIAENKDNPFFMYLCTNDIHVPRWPHDRFRGKSPLGLRGDAIAQFDWTVGEVMKALEEQGLTENTIIILSSDNGPMLDDGYVDQAIELAEQYGHRASGPLRGYKYSGYEGGTRVPFIVSWPAGVEAATEANPTLISHIDLFASLGELVGVTLPAGAAPDSGDQLDQMLGRSMEDRPWVAEQNHTNAVGIRTGKWKFIPANNGVKKVSWINNQDMQYVENANTNVDQLFDLEADPGETTNVASEHPDIIEMMKALKEEAVNGPAPEFIPPMSSDETIEYWYNISTPRRNNLVLTQDGETLHGVAGADKAEPRSQWKFVDTGDGTLHIINRLSGQYIDPVNVGASKPNNVYVLTSETPETGWLCSYAVNDGLVVFYTAGTSPNQMNMTLADRSHILVNWGGGRHDDDGCQFLCELNDTQTTAINTITTDGTADSDVWFDVYGRRVARPGHGIFINSTGRKIIR